MIRSKDIKDYFEVQFGQLIADRRILFDIYLYFTGNEHVLMLVRVGEKLPEDWLSKYRGKGIQSIWIHNDDREAWEKYLKGQTDQPAKTAEGALIKNTIESEKIKDEQKETIVAEAAKQVLAEAAEAKTPEEQKKADEKAKLVVQDVIADAVANAAPVVQQIWKIANVHPELSHAVNVSTYSVIFAMAFGRIDMDLLAELALAGLLHDVGLSQIPFEVVSKSWNKFSAKDQELYSPHVDHSMGLIAEHGHGIPERVKELLSQHHEKFDGTGYPKKLEGFNFDDIAQLVAMSDLHDAFVSGQWDEKERNLSDAIDHLKGLEKAQSFPQYFNPDIFNHVLNWVNNTENDPTVQQDALKVVEQQTMNVIENADN